MPRKFRKTLILAKVETTPGTDSVPAGSDAVLVSDATFETVYENVERNILRPTFGHSGMLVGTRYVRAEFTCELFSGGALGVAPAYGPLLRACAMAETITPTTLVEYEPISEDFETLTIKYSADGVIHTMLGCMGTVNITMTEGERPTMRFSFVGIDGGPAAASAPTPVYTAWRTPQVVTAQNSDRLTIGGTYSAGVVSGGTEYCSRGLTFDLANDAKYIAMLCDGTGPDITDRKPTGNFELELSAAQEVTLRGDINANTKRTLGLLHGSSEGNRVGIFVTNAMLTSPTYQDFEGRLLVGVTFNAEPITGDDEFVIYCR